MALAPCGSLEALNEGASRNAIGGASRAGTGGEGDSSASAEFKGEWEFRRAKSFASPGGPANCSGDDMVAAVWLQ